MLRVEARCRRHIVAPERMMFAEHAISYVAPRLPCRHIFLNAQNSGKRRSSTSRSNRSCCRCTSRFRRCPVASLVCLENRDGSQSVLLVSIAIVVSSSLSHLLQYHRRFPRKDGSGGTYGLQRIREEWHTLTEQRDDEARTICRLSELGSLLTCYTGCTPRNSPTSASGSHRSSFSVPGAHSLPVSLFTKLILVDSRRVPGRRRARRRYVDILLEVRTLADVALPYKGAHESFDGLRDTLASFLVDCAPR